MSVGSRRRRFVLSGMEDDGEMIICYFVAFDVHLRNTYKPIFVAVGVGSTYCLAHT